ncbi:pheromone-processing carboxypeptidase KEX1-like [Quercus suber]|uniref:pheromone-processing carboxypeptidase KEX1-like n=1 Tax=Quercus suber TaxID=58331 RepID=UPI000CE198BB|nr:pheromone-processing carboxypeptidase KEX1-like [Quercus suber]
MTRGDFLFNPFSGVRIPLPQALLAFCRLNYRKNWSYYQVRGTGEGAFHGQGQEDDFLNVRGINIFRGDDEVDDDSDDEDYDSSNEDDDDSDDEDYNSSNEDNDNSDNDNSDC